MNRRPAVLRLDFVALFQVAYVLDRHASEYLREAAPRDLRASLSLESIETAVASGDHPDLLDDLRAAVRGGHITHDWLDYAEHLTHLRARQGGAADPEGVNT